MSGSQISIIMATRNAVSLLPEALASVTAHAADSPLLIWDGASTDGTKALLAAENASITRWESAHDRGIYDAFTRALAWVDTPFVFFLGADDRLRPEWTQAAEAVTDTNRLYYGDVWLTGAQQRYRGAFHQRDLARTNICQQAVFYPASIFKRHSFHPDYPLQADWELNMWCWQQPDIEFHYLPFCVCDFNDQSGQSTLHYDQAFNRDYPGLLRQYFSTAAWLRFGLPAWLAHHTRSLRGRS